MKNCIVLSGQYRTFDKTWQKIKSLIDKNHLDVYCHLWSTDEQEIKNVNDRLKPIGFLSEDFSKYSDIFDNIEKNILSKNPKGPNQDKLAANASMNYGRKVAFDLVPKQKYDSLVYCRYDINFTQSMYFESIDKIITPAEQSYNLISDIFALMPFKMANSYFLYDNYEMLHSTSWEPEFLNWLRNIKKYPEQDIQTHIHTRYCPHLMLMRNIIMHGHDYVIYNLPVFIQR